MELSGWTECQFAGTQHQWVGNDLLGGESELTLPVSTGLSDIHGRVTECSTDRMIRFASAQK